MKRYTLCCMPNSRFMKQSLHLFLGTFLLLLLTQKVQAQQPSFEENLQRINQQLDQLADSLVPGLNETANFSVVNTSVQDLLRAVAETHRLNVNVDPALQARITNNFTNVQVKNLLLFLVKEYRLDIDFINSILSFHSFQEAVVKQEWKPKKLQILYNQEADRLTLDLKQDSLSVFVRQLTQNSNKNVLIAPNVQERLLNGYITDMPFEQALKKMAYSNNLEVNKTEDGFFIIKNLQQPEAELSSRGGPEGRVPQRGRSGQRGEGNYQPNAIQNLLVSPVYGLNDTLLNIEAINVPIRDVIQEASLALGKDYIFFSEPQGSTVSNVQNVSYDELLSFLLHGTTHAYQKQAKVYLIGDRGSEGFRSTRLKRFQFRTIEDVEKLIPAEVAKGVQITPFKDLNGLVLSGSVARLDEIEAFLHAIDQPVPNILIEVIVMDIRKGTSIQTGITAFLGDSAVQTQGQIFPGTKVTISSNSINGILDLLENTGVANLGRVRPNLSASIKALEQNQNVKVRSTPQLSTLNGHEAALSIGQSVYYLEQTQNVTGGVNPIITSTQRFNKVDANLSIKILPVVSGDEHITLKIDAEFSDFIKAEIPNAPPGNATRKFISQIRVRNGDMIVLGGLEEARKEKNSSGFPVLSRIPVLKWLFSQKSNSYRDDQLMVFIRPTVVY